MSGFDNNARALTTPGPTMPGPAVTALPRADAPEPAFGGFRFSAGAAPGDAGAFVFTRRLGIDLSGARIEMDSTVKRRRGLFAALSMLPAIAFSIGASLAQEVRPVDMDSRTAIVVTPAERNYILNQMRMFVSSIQTVAAGLGADDRAQASEAAAARGLQRNANDPAFPPTLDAKLPPQWKQLGGGMRRGFDALAQGISAGAGTQKSLEQLGIVMTNCVACHATYRVATSHE